MMKTPRMSLACSWLLLAAATSGCSLVYDADDLRAGRDGGGGPTADADPDALFVARVSPEGVFEGEGSSFDPEETEMVRAIPIVLEGQNMTAETVFTIAGLGMEMEIEDVAVSGDGHFAAFALRVPILPDLTDGVEDAFNIQLVKGDEDQLKLLRVSGLDGLVQEGGTLNTDELNSRYTHVVLSGSNTATGSAPLRIVATAGIDVAGTLSADAGAAPAAGPGGCAGGAAANAADCGDGSGKAGASDAAPGGGGGGGYGSGGTAGTGGGGQPGSTAGQVFMVPLPPDPNATARGSGGGGGGGLTGGRGGGSGGVIELTTPATLTLQDGSIVSASGGGGEQLTCATGGGGGGGSGGAILVRAGRLVLGAEARIEARGGSGSGGGTCVGGNGGNGRIRIDRGNDGAADAEPSAFFGPAPVIDDLPAIVGEEELAVPVRGKINTSYQLFIGESETPATFETDADGLGSAEVALEPGLNQLCVQVAPAADLEYPEAKNCVNVAYIKP
jgi:hypothetical protein